MGHRCAILCHLLPLALAACVAEPAAPLTTPELCDGVETLRDIELTVLGPFSVAEYTPIGGTLVACTPGTCCNQTYYGPTIACAAGVIYVVPDPELRVPDGGGFALLPAVCTSYSEDLRPSDACPVGSVCASEFLRLRSLTGRVVRRPLPLLGPDDVWVLEARESTSDPPPRR